MTRLVAALLAAMLAAGPTAAQGAWPALHDVHGPGGATLRAGPGPTHPAVATLPAGAAGVEVIRPGPRGTWGLVNHGEGTAWVRLTDLARRTVPPRALPALARCFGTEPFWTLGFDGPAVTFAPSVGPAVEGVSGDGFSSSSHSGRFVRLFGDGATEGAALVRREACGDGMSDRAYGFDVDLLLRGPKGATLLSGCCSLLP